MPKFSLFLTFTVVVALLCAVAAREAESVRDKVAPKSSSFTLEQRYKNHRASGKLSAFVDSIYRSVLGAGSATATPSNYGIFRRYGMGDSANPCVAPVTEGISFGLGVCYNLYDYETNSTNSAIYKYNSTTATAVFYVGTGCSGKVLNKLAENIGKCSPEGDFKIMASSKSPIVSTNPGFVATVYGSQNNCLANNGAGVQGINWVPTTTNNCIVYEVAANQGNSSSWACTGPNSATYIEYNETSNCYGQGQASTFPLFPSGNMGGSNCQSPETMDIISGWVAYGCNAPAPSNLRTRSTDEN